MPIQVQTSLMAGGLDLASPPIAMQAGRAISCSNYEPDVAGYTSIGGYERFDGHPRPSDSTDPTTIAERRNTITAVPGTGPVRGIWVYNNDVYAFRDQTTGFAGMFKATTGGWSQMTFGYKLTFTGGTQEFIAGEYVAGVTSTATGFIDRVIVTEGVWDGTAIGYLIVSNVVGTFTTSESLLSASSGAAVAGQFTPIVIQPGGRYDFTNHNFYGATDRTRMYFASGADTAFEWSGSYLTPIHTGISAGTALSSDFLLAANGDFIIADNSDSIVMASLFDAPSFIAHFQNHLFLGYSSGTLLNSSIGEPLEFSTTAGAGEIAFGETITGLLTAAATSIVIFAQNRIDYITGTDTTTFVVNPISDSSGAQPYTVQMMDAPMFLDDAGVRSMPTTAAFGDWRMASVTPLIESLIRHKRDSGVNPVASMIVKGRDQYRLFWNDGSGLTVYIGRKNPEAMPFKLPVQVYCACSGEVVNGQGDRLFVGCQDGFVYEMNRGTSYDGAAIDSYIRLPFTATGSPAQHTRWMKVTFELDTPDAIDLGVAFHTDYGRGDGGALDTVDIDAGTSIITTDAYSAVDWTQVIEGRLEYHLAGIGPNISTTLVHSSATARPHTISSQTYNFSRRRLKR
ncbi:MAG: hypothetical protein ABWY63_00705 [Hyphomicrobiaceae bacterium]